MIPSTPTTGSPIRTSSNTISASASASLRPRTNRLISGLDDFSPDFYAAGSSPSGTPLDSPFFSRAQSPIPSKHPSRSSSTNPQFRQPVPSEQGSDLAASLSGLWGKSWTSLQGLASTVLGSDATVEPIKDKIPHRNRRTLETFATRLSPDSKQWGPSQTSAMQPGAGSKEERNARLRARKREELLRDSSGPFSNNSSRHKRRTSDDLDSSSVPAGEHDDRDTLVYIHHVSSQDTLPGISIKFSCPLAIIKKANRLWSNDSVQFRKTLVLPVDACNVKGRRVRGPETSEEDLLGSSSDDNDQTPKASVLNPWTVPADDPLSHQASFASIKNLTSPQQSPSLSSQKSPEEPPWKHDSWVVLANHPTAIEIARLPRQDIGFFPRARRKSNSLSHYSDGHSTSSTSLDLPRPSITVSDTATDRVAHQQQSSRRSSGTQPFSTMMIGPGGVGTLGGKGPSAPGPAEDKLNKVFSKHLPSIMTPGPPADDPEPYASGASTPTLALEHMGSAIEGWVRKLAKTAVKAVEPVSATHMQSQQRARATGIRARSGEGDLIELSDAFEIGEDDGEDERVVRRNGNGDWNGDDRGRSRSSVAATALEETAWAARERVVGGGNGGGEAKNKVV